MSDKYDTLRAKLQTLEEDRIKDKKTIVLLEDKIETLERKMRATGIEIRNAPRATPNNNKPESKVELSNLVKTIGESVAINLNESDIKDVYRINSSKETIKPIIVELNSVIKKETLINAVKTFNRNKSKEEKLNSKHIKLPGLTQPIFVAETLTFKAQKLYYLAREFQRLNKYAYCWTSKGTVHLRKSEGSPLIRINTESDLAKLSKSA